jgi:hypothetical protein
MAAEHVYIFLVDGVPERGQRSASIPTVESPALEALKKECS